MNESHILHSKDVNKRDNNTIGLQLMMNPIPPKTVRNYHIRVQRQALFAQSATLCFQYLGFHDHTFNRAKLANYVICPGFHGFRRGFQ